MAAHSIRRLSSYFLILSSCAILAVQFAQAQNKAEKQQQDEEVMRVNTELVQTDVMVFDKQGHFVDGLKPEQFALKVDGKPQPVSFFERVTAGSSSLEAVRAKTNSAPTTESTARGRILIFFVDDFHLAPASLVSTRKSLLRFIDHGMGANDEVAITSVSGQIGFLQQFTNDKAVLRAAVARLNYRANAKTDMGDPPMSEYAALKIREGDEGLISYYVSEILRQNTTRVNGQLLQFVTPETARYEVQERARQITIEAAPATDNTLLMLEGLMRTAGQLPGRKLVFFISDGFYLSDKKTGSPDKIRRITDAAGRAGVVIYTLDARGLVTESIDATNNMALSSEGLTLGASIGELSASQDGLNALAKDTGGRAFRNTNLPMDKWVYKVLDETSVYYLLAWRPDNDMQKSGKFKRIQVTIADRPDLTVRLRNGYFKNTPLQLLTTKKKKEKDPEKAREDELRVVIDSTLPQREIPTRLAIGVVPIPPIGRRLTASIQINRDALTFASDDGKQAADVEIGGIVYDDKGKPASSFVGRLKVYPRASDSSQPKGHDPIYSFNAWLPPGLYQVRVGLRDSRSGRMGSAMEWVAIQ